MPRRWNTKSQNTVASLGDMVIRLEALVIAKRLSTLKAMVLLHKPELMQTEQGRTALERVSQYMTALQSGLRPQVLHGK